MTHPEAGNDYPDWESRARRTRGMKDAKDAHKRAPDELEYGIGAACAPELTG
jgi:hypothetical protein